MRVTIKTIAEMAGVSRGTVDKVIHDRPGVNVETKEKVLAIIKELNYKPNPIGKALVKNQSPIKIGVILTPEHNPFIKDMLKGIKQAEEEFYAFGIEVITHIPETLETREHLSILEELERERVDGIALFPIHDKKVRAKITELQEKGISILTFNSRVDNINELCFVGQDHFKGGKVAAGLMSKLLPDGGEVGIILSSHQLSCHDDRLSGFINRLNDCHSAISIVEIRENQDKRSEAKKIATKYLTKHPNLKGIYITGGGVEGVVDAFQSENRSVKLIGHDLTDGSATLLKEHSIDFIIDQKPVDQGYIIIKTLFEYLFKKITPKKFVEIPVEIIMEESL